MANNQTLLNYLMVAPPALPTPNTNKAPNTRNPNYNWGDTNSVALTLTSGVDCIVRCELASSPLHLILQTCFLLLLRVILMMQQLSSTLPTDIAFFQAGSESNSSPNRCPGDLKVSWKWECVCRDEQVAVQSFQQLQFQTQSSYTPSFQCHSKYFGCSWRLNYPGTAVVCDAR
ncbi:hypothetical protein I7I51_01062 [Histoplasma capsulatum]|uniref:Uncharacterized protein n=1 Tax=Ajellomyces capsulatus TaxID=5037 RepID=A0A8A1MDJ9_AJECA|nr:hypothetical protein I7I51_01062 [Histoplasma capsulatum]